MLTVEMGFAFLFVFFGRIVSEGEIRINFNFFFLLALLTFFYLLFPRSQTRVKAHGFSSFKKKPRGENKKKNKN
jgi:hypothetical protein